MKIDKDILRILTTNAVETNPYIRKAIEHYVNGEVKYLWNGEVYSKKELDAEYIVVAGKDIEQGFKERMVGYYDKWYRYNRADEGRAYDMGVKLATKEDGCKGEMIIIPA